ncbi:bifunctional glutamate N-acetyltransferase/amino-acid acetyltransferase ArgJ [Hoyosella sp. G463]|uniref:Arginine biosynthesis bifunctional protein ArgJ n=1 Tax=Lolliginicoccus lacisalsi TaxID=2742202 RepID=A0A927PL04_9ACTN|nr:bifunctional glutamate N-acetyltransferase/amino-acid acetyltransferase ArgJ [Lolliginicoccus lacisalsi]MBD8506600.1 bifunctional glutamate N-acetyltransferase/amino-acid acetyltransferase ArgJ [Lolliginicoccus lacisalsi]
MSDRSHSATAPAGFHGITGNIGIKDDAPDFFTVISEVPATVSAVFTKSRFAGPSVVISRETARRGTGRGIVVTARNANVATGDQGLVNAREIRAAVAGLATAEPEDILIASTGVIGRQLPMDRVREFLDGLQPPFPPADFAACAQAMMTTDTHPKHVAARCGEATIVGIAKGVGMIEPNMATMLAYFFTDARIAQADLDALFRRVVDRTFNALSIDTDTSTSDTAAILANGLAGDVDLAEFEAALHDLALQLVRMIAADGEGATKTIVVRVTEARDERQAKRVAKAIVNSPLVKTAVHGADPNWGRVAMAIGKCDDETDIDPERVRIDFGDVTTYPIPEEDVLDAAAEHMSGDEVTITASLGTGDAAFTVYGCDLTDGYIRINADYTT